MICCGCGQTVSRDEAGMTKKLINRGTDLIYCYQCLGGMFRISREKLQEMADSYRASGCTLFR